MCKSVTFEVLLYPNFEINMNELYAVSHKILTIQLESELYNVRFIKSFEKYFLFYSIQVILIAAIQTFPSKPIFFHNI